MSKVPAKHTKPELELRKQLTRFGMRYRLHKAGLPGRPDIVFGKYKIAVFCDGDFWHGRHWKKRQAAGQFKVRRKYWLKKIDDNIRRDRRVNYRLKKDGWVVLRYWETEIRTDSRRIALEIGRHLKRRRSGIISTEDYQSPSRALPL